MSARRFTALGTASQVPTTRRSQHSSFLKWDKEGFLFDPGESTQRQMIFSGISASEITKIFITHFHGDHCLGLSSILQRLALDKVPHTVQIYFPSSGMNFFENIKGVASYHDVAFLKPHPIAEGGILYEDDNLVVSSRRLDHTIDTFGYRIEEKDSVNLVKEKLDALAIEGPIVGELKSQGQITFQGKEIHLKDVSTHKKGQSFAFVMDTRVCDAAIELAKDVDMLVTESTFLDQDADKAQSHGHLTAFQAGQLANKANAGKLVLTHFSQRYDKNTNFATEALSVHDDVIQLNDRDIIEIERE